jgi:hypothetical protein
MLTDCGSVVVRRSQVSCGGVRLGPLDTSATVESVVPALDDR